MGRPIRVWYPGAMYHVMSRGNRRTGIFKDDKDYITFLEGVQLTQMQYPFRIHALCLMTNHFHMSIETEDVNLSRIMQRMLHSYSREFNEKYDFSGHLFESRYTACIIENERYFVETSRYIHLNPVKAHIVDDPILYPYSSYPIFMDPEYPRQHVNALPLPLLHKRAGEMIRGLVDTSRVLESFGSDTPDGRKEYKAFVESRIPHEEQDDQIRKDIKDDE